MQRNEGGRGDGRPAVGGVVLLVAVAVGCDSPDDEFLAQVKLFDGEAAAGHSADDGHDHSHDILTPLDQPSWVAGADARHLRPEDPVLGFLAGAGHDQPFAIPWWILKNHHVANLELAGTPVCITLCERCSSAAAWEPEVDGRRLHLRVNGIYDGTHVCIDDTTGTWFTPFSGKGMAGPLAGRQLERLRLDQATWADWFELHPTTQVVVADEAMREGHGSEDSPGSAGLGSRMRKSIRHLDPRLPENDLVLGVAVGGDVRAYPMKALTAAGGVVADRLGDLPIVVLHKPGTWLAAAFRAELDGQPLTFARGVDGAIREVASQGRVLLSGLVQGGAWDGRRLAPVQYGMEEWYIWATQHPGTSIHGS